jgi:replication factor C subunit 3/5
MFLFLLMEQTIPWVEKYRPTTFNNIVLDPINRRIFENILEKNYFPNVLFYGPPGTGKTTTIINLINKYQQDFDGNNKENIIHLNASDERGIDIIRNQIQQFVKSNNFYNNGLKFVILDEVDYMTKNAQQALKYLIQSSKSNVRYCLICNYISKIEESLRNEFICIRFNQLPKDEIFLFLKNIIASENMDINDETIRIIQDNFSSDIRSMINFIQLNQQNKDLEHTIVTSALWEELYLLLKSEEKQLFKQKVYDISGQYNIDKITIIKEYAMYILKNKPECVTSDFLDDLEMVFHSNNLVIDNALDFLYERSKV